MSSEPQGLSFLSISSSSSSPSPSAGQLQSFDSLESPCFQMPESQCHQSNGGEGFVPYSQRKSDPYSQKSAERFRRHSVDGSPVGRDCDLTENSHYHPYRRQCSEGAISEGQPFSCVRRAGLAREIASADGLEEQSSWTTLGTDVETTSIMGTRRPYSEPQESSEEPPGYTTVNHQAYSAISPLQHQYYPSRGIDTVSHYYNQSLSTQTSQDSSPQPPEELERLLGERPEKLKSHFSLPSSHTHSQPFRVNMHPAYGHQPVHENRILNQKALYNPLTSQNAVLPPPYISPDPLAFQYYSPATHQPSVGHPSSPRTGSLDSPLPAHTPPSYSTALQAGHSGTASMQVYH